MEPEYSVVNQSERMLPSTVLIDSLHRSLLTVEVDLVVSLKELEQLVAFFGRTVGSLRRARQSLGLVQE